MQRRLLLQRASSASVAIAAAACTYTTAQSRRRPSSSNPNGLNDADWYNEQHAHIALGLPLVEEARQGWWHEVTRRLRQNGEDANSSDPYDRCTLLHLASAEGRRRLVEELLDLGAAASPQDTKGRTPLHYCAEHGSESVASTLVHGGACVNQQDVTGAVCLANHSPNINLQKMLKTQSEKRK